MQLGGLTGVLYKICDWIMKFAYVNLLWLFFTFVGLIVFGIMPSTASLFTVIRKWIMGQDDVPVFKTFWNNYKTSFIKINIIGIILFVVGMVLYFDYYYFKGMTGALSNVLLVVMLMITFLYLLVLLYIFPTFAHFELTILRYFKYSIILAISNLLSTIMMIAGAIIVYFLFRMVPGLIPFFGGSVLGFVLMWAAYRGFAKIERLREAKEEEEKEKESQMKVEA
ncbi:putative membrane protein YesL [Pullulanibacillus pueri]|uniref:DUF624 domain-containing protein n=1 Tax=Pullulanibacillus pueri TaxID=1437324 RepID=A0A8J2ZTE3_9BACL|nr:YesL family protein [Pullulanibacillus pueri]MBM7681796.1 putative membrane protein YesL [Pullulanibacillus pueri]GGH76120.1 hypothetical protein GCM10007096_06070 [Pullulanibacillus pueri]